MSAAPRARFARRTDGTVPPKRDRTRRLTRIDRRTPLGKRVTELEALFTSAFAADDLTPMRREKIGAAAQLQAMAEAERGAWMRGEARCDLDELVRLERRATQSVKAIGIPEGKSRQPTPASVAATSAPDLTQLSDAQLDRLGALLMGEAKGSDAEALRMDTEARRARAAEEPRT
jgi:hypothetical protein